MATIPEPQPDHQEIPVPDPDDHPQEDQPIEPNADLPPGTSQPPRYA